MALNNRQVGNGIRIFGWLVVLFYLVSFGLMLPDMLSDPVMRSLFPLVFIEGVPYWGGGLFLVWLGRRVRKNAAQEQGIQ